jgi:hypothetical protein
LKLPRNRVQHPEKSRQTGSFDAVKLLGLELGRDFLNVHYAQFQDRLIRPKSDQLSPESLYLELAARTALLNPLASLVW